LNPRPPRPPSPALPLALAAAPPPNTPRNGFVVRGSKHSTLQRWELSVRREPGPGTSFADMSTGFTGKLFWENRQLFRWLQPESCVGFGKTGGFAIKTGKGPPMIWSLAGTHRARGLDLTPCTRRSSARQYNTHCLLPADKGGASRVRTSDDLNGSAASSSGVAAAAATVAASLAAAAAGAVAATAPAESGSVRCACSCAKREGEGVRLAGGSSASLHARAPGTTFADVSACFSA
jgi:hypothetical protein